MSLSLHETIETDTLLSSGQEITSSVRKLRSADCPRMTTHLARHRYVGVSINHENITTIMRYYDLPWPWVAALHREIQQRDSPHFDSLQQL